MGELVDFLQQLLLYLGQRVLHVFLSYLFRATINIPCSELKKDGGVRKCRTPL
jgi:hypothetical protein